MRCAIYARFSNEDRQSARSIPDQIDECVRHAEARGWAVVATYADAGISGYAVANRPELQRALSDADGGAFEILLVEDEDRLARNLGHLATMRDNLNAAGVTLATLGTDDVDLMRAAFKGFGAQQYLVDLGHKTRRGMRSNAEKGLATGSRLYGYRSSPGGETVIVGEEAETIRRICSLFADYAMTGREIAHALNLDRIPGPRGGYWTGSSICGNARRGNGILHSEIYAGVKTWNRTDVRKDPRTGKRTPYTRPPQEWKRTAVPHLQIVEPGLWARVQARHAASATLTRSQKVNRRKPGIFSGLLKCAACGSSYTSYRRGQLVCTGHRERGSSFCQNSKIVDRAVVEARALEGIRTRLLAPEAVEAYVRAYRAAWERIDRERQDRRRPLERRLGEVERGIARAVDAIVEGTDSPAVRAKLKALEAEKAEIEAEVCAQPAARPVTLHPNAAKAYRAMVEDLAELTTALAENPASEAAARLMIDGVRVLIDKIEIVPNPRGRGGVDLRLHGNLALLLAPAEEPARRGAGSLAVAGGGYRQAPSAPVIVSVELYREAA